MVKRLTRHLGSLRSLKVLKSIEFDSRFLRASSGVVKLIDILPSSIESVEFRIWDGRTVRASLVGMDKCAKANYQYSRTLCSASTALQCQTHFGCFAGTLA